jgi:hypothetical protein
MLPLQHGCTGCDVILDMRCPETLTYPGTSVKIPAAKLASHGHIYHRFIDCYLPVYTALLKWLDTKKHASSRTACILGLPEAIGDLEKALLNAHGLVGAHLISSIGLDRPLRSTSNCSNLISSPPAGTRGSVYSRGDVGRALRQHVALTLGARSSVVQSSVPDVSPFITFLVREPHAPSGDCQRCLGPKRRADLVMAELSALTALEVLPYFPNATLLATMALFSRSSLVVGMHGAGQINLIFAPRCLHVEISPLISHAYRLDAHWADSINWLRKQEVRSHAPTIFDVSGAAPNELVPWRSNSAHIMPWCAPSITWLVYGLPLNQAISNLSIDTSTKDQGGAGHMRHDGRSVVVAKPSGDASRDHITLTQLKRLVQWVELTQTDVARVASLLLNHTFA